LTKPKKKEPVIERVAQGNDWRIDRLQKAVDDGTATDQQKALLALLREGLQQTSAEAAPSEDNEQALTKEEGEADDVEPDYEKVSVWSVVNIYFY
jgi:hypothetical protein